MSKVTNPIGQLSWELYLECPHCNESVDAARADDENEIAQRIFTNEWDKVKGIEIYCPECGEAIELGGVEY